MYLVTSRICLLILFSILSCFNGCQQIIYVSQSDYFNVSTVDQLCQTFQFRSCFQYDQQVDNWSISSWELCLQDLCLGMKNTSQTYQTLEKCRLHRQQYYKYDQFVLNLILCGSSLFVVVIIIISIVFSCHKKCRPRQGRQADPIQPSIIISQFQSGQSIVPQNCEPQILEAQQYQNIICTICLSKRITVQLKCGHYSHLLCIREWRKKAGTCPVCRKIMTGIHFICKICRKKYNMRSVLDISQLEQQNEICPDCSIR